MNSKENVIVVSVKYDKNKNLDNDKNFIKLDGYWESIKIGNGREKDVEYIAFYYSAPIKKVMHYAKVIKPFELVNEEEQKYRIYFDKSSWTNTKLEARAKGELYVRDHRYTTYEKLSNAQTTHELLQKS